MRDADAMTLHAINRHDGNDNPAGGYVVMVTGDTAIDAHIEMAEYDALRRTAPAIYIRWQDGPLGRVGSPERQPMNGAGVEDVLEAALQRLEWFQKPEGDGSFLDGKFACQENAAAIQSIRHALDFLAARTARRVAAETEGTNEGT